MSEERTRARNFDATLSSQAEKRPKIALVAAMSENGAIGNSNHLPWRLAADMKRFRKLTLNHVVIMGRKTYESIGRPLPKRTNIVVSRNPNLALQGACVLVNSLQQAFRLASTAKKVFVIGGSEIYREAIRCADELYLTIIYFNQQSTPNLNLFVDFEGDAFFPKIDPEVWVVKFKGAERKAVMRGSGVIRQSKSSNHSIEHGHGIFFRFYIFRRRSDRDQQ